MKHNFERAFSDIKNKLDALNADFEEAIKNTEKLLEKCESVGIKTVSL